MSPDSIEYTAFKTRYGQFEYKVLPFGLRNAPSSFQRMMNIVLQGLIDEVCVVYIDDILIFSKDYQSHLVDVKKVLNRLFDYGLVASKEKSRFFLKTVDYLGYTVSKNEIRPMKSKVECINNWPTPRCTTDVRSFIGLCNYYRRFVKGFTIIANPLLLLTTKRDFEWTDEAEVAFKALKVALSTTPVLRMSDYTKEFHVWPDSSQFAVGGVLTQLGENNEHQPICYMSKKLSKSEQNYPTVERELMAIIHCLRIWRCYFEGMNIIIPTLLTINRSPGLTQ